MQKDKNIKLLRHTIDSINLFSTFSDTLYIDNNKISFIEPHTRGTIELNQVLLSKPSKVPLKGFVKLIRKFKKPLININKDKLEVKEYRKSSTTEVLQADLYEEDEDTISSVELKKQNRFKYGFDIPSYDSLQDEDIDYQVILDRYKINRIKELIDLTIQPKGYFVNGNPTKTKIYFTKDARKKVVKVEDRNCGIVSYQMEVKPESLKRSYQYVISYKIMRLIPDNDFKIQISGDRYISEWFSPRRKLKLSLDLLKISYANN
jgi:hypothetical protein